MVKPPAYDLEKVRADFPAATSCCYLNTGTLGPSPTVVTDRFLAAYRAWQDSYPGQPDQYGATRALMELARPRVARLIGAQAGEITLTGNSTDGVNIVAQGLDYSQRNEVVITDQEHPAVFVPWLNLAARGLVEVKMLHWHKDPAHTLRGLRSLLGAKTALVCLSHVSSMTGMVLPVREVSDLAHEAGALAMYDGAQAAGQVPVDVRADGCDLYTLNGHKWLHGTVGTGALFISRELLPLVRPAAVGSGTATSYGYPGSTDMAWREDVTKFEFGTRNWTVYAGWAESLDYLDRLGLDKIRRHQLELGDYLRGGLESMPGIKVVGADQPELRSGLVAFSVEGHDAAELCASLWRDHRIATRPAREINAVRASLAVFTTPGDVDELLRALRTMVRA